MEGRVLEGGVGGTAEDPEEHAVRSQAETGLSRLVIGGLVKVFLKSGEIKMQRSLGFGDYRG